MSKNEESKHDSTTETNSTDEPSRELTGCLVQPGMGCRWWAPGGDIHDGEILEVSHSGAFVRDLAGGELHGVSWSDLLIHPAGRYKSEDEDGADEDGESIQPRPGMRVAFYEQDDGGLEVAGVIVDFCESGAFVECLAEVDCRIERGDIVGRPWKAIRLLTEYDDAQIPPSDSYHVRISKGMPVFARYGRDTPSGLCRVISTTADGAFVEHEQTGQVFGLLWKNLTIETHVDERRANELKEAKR